jgi:hypothetical protein
MRCVSALAAFAAILIGSSSAAESAWGVEKSIEPGNIDAMLCEMGTEWRDGRSFSIFVNGHDYFAFELKNPNWNLPQGITSEVVFDFGNQQLNHFTVEAQASDIVFGNLSQEETEVFMRRFTERWELSIKFPRGQSWTVSLSGSKAATYEWIACYEEILRAKDSIPETETHENPFTGSDQNSRNPFF